MSKKRLKERWKSLKSFLKPLHASGYTPNLERSVTQNATYQYVIDEPILNETEIDRVNRERLEVARQEHDRNATDKNLLAQHRIMVATLILALVAIVSTVTAIAIALYAKPVIVPKVIVTQKNT